QHGLRVASAHRILATFGERLNRVGDPVFAFAEEFDLVIAGDEIAIAEEPGASPTGSSDVSATA
uniref:hypothetical protein n=1 Tax=Nocardia cyriacigeorgica TaxID=135487 RepID=UPI0024575009